MDAHRLQQLLAPFSQLTVTDVIDILVSTSIAYALIAQIRRTQAAQVARGIVILGIIYLAARAFDLQLTAWMFQGFFAIFLVVVVVIFQEELRQLFEQLASWRLRGRVRPAAPRGRLDVLGHALPELARQRIGALIVLPGKHPLSRHIQGGIELNGNLSLPLVRSIFDPHSPGHDGAVIIDGNRVTRFAAHLPLSKDFKQLSGVGTRHSAALGLAELTDAMCLVVSEERGTISVAHNGQLIELHNARELIPAISNFLESLNPKPRKGTRLQALRNNLVEKVGSFVLVLGLWLLFVPGGRPRTATFQVPVRVINLPSLFSLDMVSPEFVDATFSGPSRAFYLLDPDNLEVTVDVSSIRSGGRRTFRISNENLRHPQDLTIDDVRPDTVHIAVGKGS